MLDARAGMIDRLIDASVRHRFVILILAAAAALVGWRSMARLPLDALPEVGDKQVIVYSQWNRSPDLVDSQVTYPIVSALLGTPHVKSVRGISDFGASFVYVIFDDETDLYWARSRTIEYLSAVLPRLPEGVKSQLGPDATSLGWVFQYVLSDRTHTRTLAELRAYQDWYLKYYLQAVPGVAEVATVGGFVRQYQVNVDPNRLRGYGVSIQTVADALRSGNRNAGGQVVNAGGAELVVRGLGSAGSIEDLEQILVASAADGTPIRIKDVAHLTVGSDFRRGAADLDGTGDVVSGIVVMRQGENALDVIDRVKARIRQVESSLPEGVEIVPIYDRSDLIRRAVTNLKWTILEVMATVTIVILLFLSHAPSAAVPLVTLPLAVLIAFIPLKLFGIGANIMSLGGIAIAIGALVDAAIVVVEQTHKKLGDWNRTGRREDPQVVVVSAIKQVARPSFFALLVIAVSFLPVLTLQGEEGRLFRPLAYTKSLAMIVAAVLAITLDPALRLLLTRVARFGFRPAWLSRAANAVLVGQIRPEDEHPISKRIMRLYEPVVEWSLTHKRVVFGTAFVLIAGTVPIWARLGTELMPPLDEGTLLYMPSTMPGISITEAERLLQVTDSTLKQFPEVERVLGKSGRADTATDPAPLSMLETVIVLRPPDFWPRVPTWYSSWAPEWVRSILRHVTPDHVSKEELVTRMNDALKIPGVINAWSMPVRGRIDMLATGVRTPLGLKITGSSVDEIERIGGRLETVLPSVKGTRGVFAERMGQGRFLDFQWNREALGRSGITIEEAHAAIQYAIGGENVTVMVQGRERYPVNVRYAYDFRSDLQALGRVLVPAAGGHRQIPVAELAEIKSTAGPSMLRNEDGLLTGYVYVDLSTGDYGRYVDEADRVIRDAVKTPAGYTISWTGQYEAIERTRRQLMEIIPLTLLLILLLLYVNTRSVPRTLIVLLAVPFSAVGAFWAVYLLGYHMSVAVWVGLIALLGVDAETGVFMLLYLDEAYDRAKRENRLNDAADLDRAVLDGASRRVRPKFMTVATMFVGLLPIMWSMGTGSDVMKRIAAPMIGGIVTSFLLELIVYPPMYHVWRSRQLSRP
jgi:Cu(I)/Ag(I) efflux system membrane protein CusA/SilA